MKQSDSTPASNVEWLRNLITDREEQLEASQGIEGEFLAKRAALQEQLGEHQRAARPGQARLQRWRKPRPSCAQKLPK